MGPVVMGQWVSSINTEIAELKKGNPLDKILPKFTELFNKEGLAEGDRSTGISTLQKAIEEKKAYRATCGFFTRLAFKFFDFIGFGVVAKAEKILKAQIKTIFDKALKDEPLKGTVHEYMRPIKVEYLKEFVNNSAYKDLKELPAVQALLKRKDIIHVDFAALLKENDGKFMEEVNNVTEGKAHHLTNLHAKLQNQDVNLIQLAIHEKKVNVLKWLLENFLHNDKNPFAAAELLSAGFTCGEKKYANVMELAQLIDVKWEERKATNAEAPLKDLVIRQLPDDVSETVALLANLHNEFVGYGIDVPVGPFYVTSAIAELPDFQDKDTFLNQVAVVPKA